MLKYLGFMVVILAMVATMGACKSSKAKVQVFTVQVDGKNDAFASSFLAYFPNDMQVHAGDTIDFHNNFTGEPHSVTLGTDVDDVFALIAQACPNGGLTDPACQQGPPAAYADQYNALDKKLPHLLPDDPSQPIPQAAAQPCFLKTGDAPSDGSACTAAQMQPQPAFDGKQTYYNSGWLDDQQVFTVKLSKDLTPGTYYYYCLLHREGMSGTITVVDKDTKVAKPADQAATGDQQLAEIVSKLQPSFDALASLTADTATAGANSDDETLEASINEFGPPDITIAAGESVTWAMAGFHTISLNAPEDARPLLKRESDGTIALNAKTIDPANSPAEPPPDENADPEAPPPTLDAGEWDGQGFHSSGGLDHSGAYKLTFTTAGTYTYICLVHPDMEGTVTVQ